MEKPTIVLGADVYHAPPDSDRASFAAVVGSMDRWLGAYYSTVAAQQARSTASTASRTDSRVAGGRLGLQVDAAMAAGGRCCIRRQP